MEPFSIEQVLAAEARSIYDLTDPETQAIVDQLDRLASGQNHETERFNKDADTRSGKDEERQWVADRKAFYCQLGKLRSAALCCSGGGIRSATFCLGIIQALAQETLTVLPKQPTTLPDPDKTGMPHLLEREANLSFLSRFHYLSTVSGGGYIGSWLSAWRSREDFPTVWQNLRSRPDGPDVEPPELSWLRSYSNFLTPRVGLLSADTWTGIAIYLRNLLLNWLVIIPAIAVVLLFLKFIITAAGHGRLPKCVYGEGFWCKVRRVLCCAADGIAAAFAFLMPAIKALTGVIGTVLALLAVIVLASWFWFEVPPEKPDAKKEQEAIGTLVTLAVAQEEAIGKTPGGALPAANACVKADVTVSEYPTPRLNVGFLAGRPGGERTYKAWVRFANAADTPDDDRTADFRSMAIKLIGVSGERNKVDADEGNTQDLLFNGHAAYFAGDPRQLASYFSACAKGGGCDALKNPFVAWNHVTHPRGAYNLWKGSKVYPTLQSVAWHSVTPSALGDAQVKYAAIPCSQQAQYGGPGDTSYYLQQRLQARLDPANTNPICLDLKVQIRNDPPNQPIENTLVRWKGSVTGWQQVARVDIYPQEFTSPARQQFCERLAYNLYQGLKVHAPLGGINRARGETLQAAHAARLKAHGWKPFAPGEVTGDEKF